MIYIHLFIVLPKFAMFKFLKESIKEFDHVVWPTNKEAKKYFSVVVWLIVALTLFLFVVWSMLSQWLFVSKQLINPTQLPAVDQQATNTWKTASWANLDLKLPSATNSAPAATNATK